MEVDFYSSSYAVSVDLAIHRYSYKLLLTPKNGRDPVTEIGHGIKTYKKHREGAWKLQFDIWTNPD